MRARLFAACALAAVALSCGRASSTIAVTGPSDNKCSVTIANSLTGTAPSTGATGSLVVTTARDCTWSATTATAWIEITGAKSGQGDGTIAYRIGGNPDPAERRATIDVNGTAVLVIQDAAPCKFSVTPLNTAVSANGGAVTIAVDTLTGCGWTAASDAAWIALPANAAGTRAGSITVTVAANGGDARTGHVTIRGESVVITQAALPPPPSSPPPAPVPSPPPAPSPPPPAPEPCTFAIAPTSASIAATGGAGSVAVTSASGCTWSAVPQDNWITVTAGASGTGSGSIAYSVAVNVGGARSGTIAIAGQMFTVTQAAAPPVCTFSIAPTGQSVTDAGGSGSFAVTASVGTCVWTAASNAAWITLSNGSISGTGNGSVSFSVAANTGAARSGTITAAGKTFTVSQAAAPPPPPPCSYTLDRSSQTVAAAGGTSTVTVTASGSSCAWTAVANVTWITITSGASGSGNGSVSFSVAANTGAARSGTITIAGRTFTVNQGAGSM